MKTFLKGFIQILVREMNLNSRTFHPELVMEVTQNHCYKTCPKKRNSSSVVKTQVRAWDEPNEMKLFVDPIKVQFFLWKSFTTAIIALYFNLDKEPPPLKPFPLVFFCQGGALLGDQKQLRISGHVDSSFSVNWYYWKGLYEILGSPSKVYLLYRSREDFPLISTNAI